MKALHIKNELHWNRGWSSELGAILDTRDSSNDLLIFSQSCSEEDILRIIGKVSPETCQIIDLEEAPEEDCEFVADSGACYRRPH